MRSLYINLRIIILIIFQVIFRISSCYPIQSAIDAACALNSQIESLGRHLVQQQKEFMNQYESTLFQSQLRKKVNSIDYTFTHNKTQKTDQWNDLYASLKKDIFQGEYLSLQTQNQIIQSRRILNQDDVDSGSEPNSQDGKQQQNNGTVLNQDPQILLMDQDDHYLQAFVKAQNDQSLFHSFLKEQVILEHLYMQKVEDQEMDITYQVPSQLVYTTMYNETRYNVIKLPDFCSPKAQRVIQQRYFYFCDNKRVFIYQYLKMRKETKCYKQLVYTEGCICPADKFGLYCSDQVKIDCSITRYYPEPYGKSNNSVDQNKVSKIHSKSRNLNDSELGLGVFSNKISTFDKTGFNLTLSCSNQQYMTEILNNRFKIVNGMCPGSMVSENPKGCFLQDFQYIYQDQQNKLRFSENITLNFILEISNWKRITQPYIFNSSISNPSLEMLIGKEFINIPINLEELQQQLPDFDKSNYIQFGQMWYTMNIGADFSPTKFSDYLVSLAKFNGILEEQGYNQPRLNYFQMLIINKWDLIDYITIVLILFFIVTFCLFSYFIFSSINKYNLFSKCFKLIKSSKKCLYKRSQSVSDDNRSDVYNGLQEV